MIGCIPAHNHFSILQYYCEVYFSEDLYVGPICGPNLRHYTSLGLFLDQEPGDEGHFTDGFQ